MGITSDPKFEAIVNKLRACSRSYNISSMGRHQLLLGGKMFATYSAGYMSFKLQGNAQEEAFNISCSEVWYPTGRNNPSRNWVQLPNTQDKHWHKFVVRAATQMADLGPD